LKQILKVIVPCGQQNQPLRGHTEDDSNFMALLRFRAALDPVFSKTRGRSDNRAKYTSPQIQNELIQLCGEQIRQELVDDCNKASWFAFIADEATDSATKEIESICVRFIDMTCTDGPTVRKNFWVLLANLFLDTLVEYVIDTMTSDRLSALALMHAYKHTAINVNKIVDTLCESKQMRLMCV
jgi:hypothetical protein